MSLLPTPPHTNTRPVNALSTVDLFNKENVPPRPSSPSSPSPRLAFPLSPKSSPPRAQQQQKPKLSSLRVPRVVFSESNRHHPYTSIIKSIPSSRMAPQPRKSSLRAPAVFSPIPDGAGPSKPRETTPEPENPLQSESFLWTPVNRLLSSVLETDTSGIHIPVTQHDLTEAYSTLGVRLRAHFKTDDVANDAPALKSLRENEGTLAKAFVRELGRPLVEPVVTTSDEESSSFESWDEDHAVGASSKPKKKGVSAAQITFARDAFVLTQTAIRTISAILTTKILFNSFSDSSLSSILKALLAIPLAEKLYLPNGRKTTMLAMWALQNIRLPARVVEPLSSDYMDAIGRALDGKLGKEGKKGAGCEAMTAVASMCRLYPAAFLPRMSALLPTILARCTPPSTSSAGSPSATNMCTRATNALGGIALGIANWSRLSSTSESRAARHGLATMAYNFIEDTAGGTSLCASITVAMSTTCEADAGVLATSPMWAASVLSSLVVILGYNYFSSASSIRCVLTTVKHAYKTKSLTRLLAKACATSVVWAACQDEPNDDDGWKMVQKNLLIPAGVTAVASLRQRGEGGVNRVLAIVKSFTRDNNVSALHIFNRLVSSSHPKSPWFDDLALCRPLLDGTVLAHEWKGLTLYLRDLSEGKSQPDLLEGEMGDGEHVAGAVSHDDILPFGSEIIRERCAELIGLWEALVGRIAWQSPEKDDSGIASAPTVLFDIWEGILKAFTPVVQDDAVTRKDLTPIVNCIIGAMGRHATASDDGVSYPRGVEDEDRATAALAFTRKLWDSFKEHLLNPACSTATATSHLRKVADSLPRTLMVPDTIPLHDAVVFEVWSDFMVDIFLHASSSALETFTRNMQWDDSTSQTLWCVLAARVTSRDEWDSWTTQDGLDLLQAPFSEDVESPVQIKLDVWMEWEALLERVLDKAVDKPMEVLSSVALVLNNCEAIDLETSLRTITSLIKKLDLPTDASVYSYRSTSSTQQPYFEETELGQDLVSVLAVVNNVLARIPPSTITHLVDFDAALAMLNELLIMIRKVPGVYAVLVFGALQEGLCTWLVPCPEDETCFTAEQYDEKLATIYIEVLRALQDAAPSSLVLHRLDSLLTCVFDGNAPIFPILCVQAFQSFWLDNYQSLDQSELHPYPEKLKPVLKSLLSVTEEIDAPGLSFSPSDSSSGESSLIEPQPAPVSEYISGASDQLLLPSLQVLLDAAALMKEAEIVQAAPDPFELQEAIKAPLVDYESTVASVMEEFVDFAPKVEADGLTVPEESDPVIPDSEELVISITEPEVPSSEEVIPDSQEELEDESFVDNSLELVAPSPVSPEVKTMPTEVPPTPAPTRSMTAAMLTSILSTVLPVAVSETPHTSPIKAITATSSARKRMFLEAVEVPTLASLKDWARPLKKLRTAPPASLEVVDDVFSAGPSVSQRAKSFYDTPSTDREMPASDDAPVGFDGVLMSSGLRRSSRHPSNTASPTKRSLTRTFSAPETFSLSLSRLAGSTSSMTLEELYQYQSTLRNLQKKVDAEIASRA